MLRDILWLVVLGFMFGIILSELINAGISVAKEWDSGYRIDESIGLD